MVLVVANEPLDIASRGPVGNIIRELGGGSRIALLRGLGGGSRIAMLRELRGGARIAMLRGLGGGSRIVLRFVIIARLVRLVIIATLRVVGEPLRQLGFPNRPRVVLVHRTDANAHDLREVVDVALFHEHLLGCDLGTMICIPCVPDPPSHFGPLLNTNPNSPSRTQSPRHQRS